MFASDDPRTPQRELDVRPPVDRPTRPRMDTQWPVAVEHGETRRRGDRMALLGAHRLRTINQPARPDARATRRNAIEQPKPLSAPVAPRANEHRPHCAARKRLCRHADLVLDPAVIETNERRLRFRPNVTMHPQGRSLDHRQIVDRASLRTAQANLGASTRSRQQLQRVRFDTRWPRPRGMAAVFSMGSYIHHFHTAAIPKSWRKRAIGSCTWKSRLPKLPELRNLPHYSDLTCELLRLWRAGSELQYPTMTDPRVGRGFSIWLIGVSDLPPG